jgi:hypothetical protein
MEAKVAMSSFSERLAPAGPPSCARSSGRPLAIEDDWSFRSAGFRKSRAAVRT